MARNRKRAKERRARRPASVGNGRPETDEAPSPLAHAAPDVELAEAQLALGRPELLEPESESESEPEEAGGGRGPRSIGGGLDDGDSGGSAGGGGLAVPSPSAPEARVGTASRLVGFLQGSWRELQRVQWPDRRQVMQATGVVIGFVIVAGVFLGVADTLAQHLVNYILYGHW